MWCGYFNVQETNYLVVDSALSTCEYKPWPYAGELRGDGKNSEIDYA